MGLAGQDLREVGRDCLALGLVSLERSVYEKIILRRLQFCNSIVSRRVGLKKARLGDEQLRALLSCSLGRTRFLPRSSFFILYFARYDRVPQRLRQIDLSGVNLSAVPSDLLALVDSTKFS